MRFALLAVVLSFAAGCGPQEALLSSDLSADEAAADVSSAEGPLLGAGAKDSADRTCNVVLRSAQRTPLNGGYQTKCGAAGCFTVWSGFVDVSDQAVAEGAKPYILYRAGSSTTWSKVAATKSSGAPAGWVRYVYRLEKNTLSDGISFTGLQTARVELSPYVLTKAGARVFDHNRRSGDLDTYVLSASTGWDLADDANVCQPRPEQPTVLAFENGWQQGQHGTLVAGHEAVVTYPLDRLPQCRATHNGFPAWGTSAFVRFSPGGQVVQGSVVAFNSVNGNLAGVPGTAVPFSFSIPAGTSSLEVWFLNSSGAGNFCEAYDSNQGANYRFTVEPANFQPVQWVGNAGSSFSRACTRGDGVPSPVVIDSYIQQRACSFVEVDVYVPGLTDGAVVKGEAVLAQVEPTLDGRVLPVEWLTFIGRVGNNYRFHYQLPVSSLYYGPKWQTFGYTFRFSTDGRAWVRDVARTASRDPSFVNPAWPTWP
jgi:hypothetical protein